MITLTPKAVAHIKKQFEKRGGGIGITIGVKKVGCSGYAYDLNYVDAPVEGTETTQDGISVFVREEHLFAVGNLELDYVRKGLLNEGFEFKNPNEKARCGCGESFTV